MRCYVSVAVLSLLAMSTVNATAQTVAPAEAQAIAKDAYVYSYAMMESYQTWRTQTVEKTANGYVGVQTDIIRSRSRPTTRTSSRRTTTRPIPGHGSICAPSRWWSASPRSRRTAIT